MKKARRFIPILCSCALICASLSACGENEEDAARTAGSTQSEDAGEQEYTRTFFAMDTVMTITAYGERAREAVDAGEAEVVRLDELFSTGSDESEISVLNAAGGGVLSDETAMLIRRSLEIWEETDGLFDISIYPVMKLWGFADGNYRVPDSEELEETLALVRAGDLILTEQGGVTVLSMEDGMQIDLGGIVKGYAGDRVADILAEYGIENAVINLGGDVRVMGTRPDGTGWRVGIQDPEDTEAYLGGLALSDLSVVTSGGYERYFVDEETGVRHHHIIDPRTGDSADAGLISVSVISADGTLADALSTALFIMGTEEAVAYCAAYSEEIGFDALLMSSDREIYITGDLANCFIDLAGDTELHVIETQG